MMQITNKNNMKDTNDILHPILEDVEAELDKIRDTEDID